MKIMWEARNRAVWHLDCPRNKHNSGVMREISHDVKNKISILECLHCDKCGILPFGSKPNIELDIEETTNQEGEQ